MSDKKTTKYVTIKPNIHWGGKKILIIGTELELTDKQAEQMVGKIARPGAITGGVDPLAAMRKQLAEKDEEIAALKAPAKAAPEKKKASAQTKAAPKKATPKADPKKLPGTE